MACAIMARDLNYWLDEKELFRGVIGLRCVGCAIERGSLISVTNSDRFYFELKTVRGDFSGGKFLSCDTRGQTNGIDPRAETR